MDISSPIPKNAQGRFYHIDCAPGDLAPYILTCGDPDRARRIARHFDRVEMRRKNREFLIYTGFYKGIPVSVMATGIGAPATAIAIVEAANCINPVTFMRLGTCGALPRDIAVGDLVITESSWCREGTVASYVPGGIVPHAAPEIVTALSEAAKAVKMPYHVGLTVTTSDFYAGQGRAAPGFPAPDPGFLQSLVKGGVLNMEMEMAVYLALAAVSTYRIRAGGACLVLDNRETEAGFTSVKDRRRGEKRLIEVGLRALEILAARDRQPGR
ncbi:MAG: nucleoside phosphorylase [Syntrophobacterales bacterium]|jgi:uridine phosphorylase|nr:nucleoside phosphorylase [Syntrophobacterales bacterium]